MTRRILPVSEWHRLAETPELGALTELPAGTRVLVVENDHGEIIATAAAFWAWHVEGTWIHPDHQGKSAAARHVWRGLRELARESGASGFITAADNQAVMALLEHGGAQPLPQSYVMPLEKKRNSVCPQLS